METGKFWAFIIFVCIIAGIFTGVQHFQGVDAANALLLESKTKLTQTKEILKIRQDEWAKVAALAAKAQASAAKEGPLLALRDELQTKHRRLEGDFKYMVQSMRSTVEKVRADGASAEFPEVKLLNGKVLKTAKIKKLEAMNISFIHSEGFTIVPFDVLPDDIRERFDMGGNGLAEQLESAAQSIQTAKYVASNTSPSARRLSSAKSTSVVERGFQKIEGLSIKCEFPLTSQPPPVADNNLKSLLLYNARDTIREIDVSLLVMDGRGSNVMSMENALKGAIEGMIKMGVAKPSHSMMDTKVSDLPAKKCSFSGIAQGQPFNVEFLAIQKDQRVWQLQVGYSNKDPKNRETVLNMLSSVRID